jgi:hypothetical protein
MPNLMQMEASYDRQCVRKDIEFAKYKIKHSIASWDKDCYEHVMNLISQNRQRKIILLDDHKRLPSRFLLAVTSAGRGN